jgi:hypothetical protein
VLQFRPPEQGDQIGGIFSNCTIALFGQFFETGKSIAHFFQLFSVVKIMHQFGRNMGFWLR